MTDSSIETLVAQFTDTAARLNQASDSVNSILASVERRVVSANAGVETWLRRPLAAEDAEREGGETRQAVQILGFAKVDGEWGFAVKPMVIADGFFEGDTSSPYRNEYKAGEPVRLTQASRELRVAALKELPKLLEALTEQAQAWLASIDAAKQLAR